MPVSFAYSPTTAPTGTLMWQERPWKRQSKLTRCSWSEKLRTAAAEMFKVNLPPLAYSDGASTPGTPQSITMCGVRPLSTIQSMMARNK